MEALIAAPPFRSKLLQPESRRAKIGTLKFRQGREPSQHPITCAGTSLIVAGHLQIETLTQPTFAGFHHSSAAATNGSINYAVLLQLFPTQASICSCLSS